MKKLARTTTYHTIRGSQPKTERFSIYAGHSLGLLGIFDGWRFRFRKHEIKKVDSITGGARPIGRENQKYS